MFAMIGLLFIAVGVGVTVSSSHALAKYKHYKVYHCVIWYINIYICFVKVATMEMASHNGGLLILFFVNKALSSIPAFIGHFK